MNTSSNDSALIRECISGEESAWHAFVDRFSKLVYYSINKTVRSYNASVIAEDIDDIYHGVFLSIIEKDYKKLRQYKGTAGCSLSSWIRLISVRYTIDFLRKKKDHISLDFQADSAHQMHETLQDKKPSVQENLELSECNRILQTAIEALPKQDRHFMLLYYKRELSPEEIARIMNVSVSTVYSKKSRIRDKLEGILKDQGLIA